MISAYPGLPVIVVTGYVNREELKDFGEARMLQKPYTEGERRRRCRRRSRCAPRRVWRGRRSRGGRRSS